MAAERRQTDRRVSERRRTPRRSDDCKRSRREFWGKIAHESLRAIGATVVSIVALIYGYDRVQGDGDRIIVNRELVQKAAEERKAREAEERIKALEDQLREIRK